MSQEKTVLLELKKLKKHFPIRRNVSVKALEDITLSIYDGEKFGVVGESGCGKSTLGRVILQLYPQTSGATIYYGKTLEEMNPKYLAKEIAKLPEYQKKATDFYQKSVIADGKIQALQEMHAKQGTADDAAYTKKLTALKKDSKELKKNASRQLREGSRTVGSLILCKDLPAIQALYHKAQQETAAAAPLLQTCRQLEEELAHQRLEGQVTAATEAKLDDTRSKAQAHVAAAKAYRKEAWTTYRGKDILPITERCLAPEYQTKLDGNYETGINLGRLDRNEMRLMRQEMQMIFQDPAASLDPRQSVGKSIEEVFVINTNLSAAVRKEKTLALLEQVGLKREHYDTYPHALSGGQKQRVGIARAIALDTRFVVLDESVSALDVSVQAQILQLLQHLSEEHQLTYFFITHDLGVVKHFCDRILVMYLGHVCELADSKELFKRSLHPYTTSLLAAVPRINVDADRSTESVLEGDVPSAINPPKGCPFHTRCPQCMDICKTDVPPLIDCGDGHLVACHLRTGAGTMVDQTEA